MIFRKKGWLRKEFDKKLFEQMEQLKKDWNHDMNLLDRSFEPSLDVICQAKISEAKYFYLFKEAKHRHTKIGR